MLQFYYQRKKIKSWSSHQGEEETLGVYTDPELDRDADTNIKFHILLVWIQI